MHIRKSAHGGKGLLGLNWFLALVFIMMAGVGYRVAASHLRELLENPVELPLRLESFPMKVSGWSGQDGIDPYFVMNEFLGNTFSKVQECRIGGASRQERWRRSVGGTPDDVHDPSILLFGHIG